MGLMDKCPTRAYSFREQGDVGQVSARGTDMRLARPVSIAYLAACLGSAAQPRPHDIIFSDTLVVTGGAP